MAGMSEHHNKLAATTPDPPVRIGLVEVNSPLVVVIPFEPVAVAEAA